MLCMLRQISPLKRSKRIVSTPHDAFLDLVCSGRIDDANSVRLAIADQYIVSANQIILR
ncbi:hypothetical protein [Xenorhabdus szentirmaii]|uniref:Uncharacterized protein n=1 Tax=Xenorhabdus szentirmaii DSM 16338 TaxID=1427518 RepID=W1ITH8_9GAMM|nr:hypothetical protein [Xenorhabdus szentirmaii]CDL81802.1 hypothetical protein XSR1_160020 [Xenorhabdus szentirmaii DSM 16338]